MSFKHGSVAKFYYHVFDFSPQIESVETSFERDMAEANPLGGVWGEGFPGARRAVLSVEGIYNGAAYQNAARIWDAFNNATRGVWMHLPQGDGEGVWGYCGIATVSQSNITTDSNDVGKMPFAVIGTDRADLAQVLKPLVQVADAGNSAAQDGGASSANGATAYALATNIVTPQTLSITIEDSPDGITWATLATFSNFTAVKSEAIEITGTVDRYVRAAWTGPDATHPATFVVAFARR